MRNIKNKLKGLVSCLLLVTVVAGTAVFARQLSVNGMVRVDEWKKGTQGQEDTPAFYRQPEGPGPSPQTDALKLARRVADKIIKDTRFDFMLTPGKEVLGMQVIDFRHLRFQNGQVAYAMRQARVPEDRTVQFGVSSAGRIKIWLNNTLVYQQQERRIVNPREIAYSIFDMDTSFSAGLMKGENEILIKYEASHSNPVVFLRAVAENGMADPAVVFSPDTPFTGWLYLGTFPDQSSHSPEQGIKPFYRIAGKMYNWETAPEQFIPELRTDSQAAYQRDPYADWHYSHGAMVWSIMALDNESEQGKYRRFGEQYCRFTLDNMPWFRQQYDSLYAFRGSYHRIFRRTMLDDAGAPGLPFAALYAGSKDPALRELVDSIANYIYNGQTRLKDGTFCRPEPVHYTVWADDLFMSVPFLIRMAEATGEKKYYDDAAAQAIHFKEYLLNRKTGLYKHGWFSGTAEQSVAYWGRANGWVAWATVELLERLPTDHPRYKVIRKAFQEHIASLVKYQGANGLWHQLLDKPDSYEETSCTAMFTLAIARGIRKGWLSKKYRENALLGWEGVKRNIDAGGVVHGICRGTEIGMDEEFYRDRKTLDNDPRGLGAVITAGLEISKLK